MNAYIRPLATPLAIGAFTISAVTGVLIFFDIEIGLVEPVHKWLSWLLVGSVMLHVVSNRKSFAGYFSRKPAMFIMGAAALVAVGSLLPLFGEEEEDGERAGAVAAAKALESASFETVALVVRTTPAELSRRLAADGLSVSDNSMSITEIAARNGKEGGEVLASVLGKTRGKPDRD
jgi:hypothetical protein